MELKWFTDLCHFLFPACCVQCKQLCHNTLNLCDDCQQQLPRILLACPVCRIPNDDGLLCPRCYYHPPAFSRMICPYLYRNPLPHFIQSFKFSSQLIYARVFAELLLQEIAKQSLPLPHCIIPMPLHSKRTRERGFNQSLEIAKIISHRLDIPLEQNSVIRQKYTQAQSTISRKDRIKNLMQAFKVTDRLPKHVAIIDDVVTTGATIQSLAQCLKQHEVETVEIWCVARTVLDISN